jgi:hypothetical protein
MPSPEQWNEERDCHCTDKTRNPTQCRTYWQIYLIRNQKKPEGNHRSLRITSADRRQYTLKLTKQSFKL